MGISEPMIELGADDFDGAMMAATDFEEATI
jgi:hypothetical protein